MSYLLTLVSVVAAGAALLDLLRLRTDHAVPDLALGWLVGAGWFGMAAAALRFGLGVPFGRATVLAVVLAPVALWGALRIARRRAKAAAAPPPAPVGPVAAPRWRPRPLWLFVPVALYVVLVTGAVVLHGTNTPTHTDDGVRVRAFAPMLAFDDRWSDEARVIYVQAAPISTFVPALAWALTGSVDHFHVNDAVLTELLALLALVIGLGAARGDPERGWAGAFALLSLPLFVYHLTSTYADAVLAMRVAGALLLALEYSRGRDRADLERAALLLGLATMVKREGELVAAAPAAVLAAQALWERWRERRPLPGRALALLAVPALVAVAAKVAAVGVRGAFPMVSYLIDKAVEAAAGAGPARPAGVVGEAARVFLDGALFRSGNQGMLYWILAAVLVARAGALRRGELLWPLLAIAAIFFEVALTSIVLAPMYTLDQSTVHRALLVVSVPAALWVTAALVDAVRAERSA
jgi:hypothetical protein